MHVGSGGGALAIGLSLEVGYVFSGGSLKVTVAKSGSNYALNLSGQLKIGANWDAEFAVSYNTSVGLQSFSLKLGNAAAGTALNNTLSVFIAGTGKGLTVGISVELNTAGGVIAPPAAPKGH